MTSNVLKLTTIIAAILANPGNSSFLKKKQKIAQTKSIIFFDDFSEKKLDRSKWNVIISHNTVNNEQQAYIDSTATIYIAHGIEAEGAQNGALVIKSIFHSGYKTKEGNKFDFLSGRIDTRNKVEFTYGSISARMKLPVGAGFWPAFWILGIGKWPDCGEIDIMENVGEPDWISAAMHGPGYFGETPIVNKVYFNKGTDISQWHVYSVDWDKNSLLFKLDGNLFYRVTRPMVENYGKWAFDNPKYLILNLALGGAYPGKVNGIKSPYFGISTPTLAKIKAGNSKVLVDWVKVTRN